MCVFFLMVTSGSSYAPIIFYLTSSLLMKFTLLQGFFVIVNNIAVDVLTHMGLFLFISFSFFFYIFEYS